MRFRRGENSKKGQVTVFIIIAVMIVSLALGYLFLRNSVATQSIPVDIRPVYDSFVSCLQDNTRTGISVLESQGGYINLPAFDPGNTYMPFSSQLNFAGTQIPYWYYISGNNIPKTQIPSVSDMQTSLGNFISQKIRSCDLRDYYSQGFVVTMGDPSSSVNIKSNEVDVSLSMPLTIQKGNETAVVNTHKIAVTSPLGELYNSAQTVYNDEQKNMFLENYTMDELMTYAPVDGVKITCGPLIWNANDIFDTLQNAITANTLELKSKGATNDYFALHLPVNDNVRFLTSQNWSNSFEVSPADGPILTATPVGNQQGLGALGFCYVPYHFVYNIKYPVLIQIYNQNEIFQFPFAVVIQGNNPRQPLSGTAVSEVNSPLCQYKNTPVQITAVDRNLNPIANATISYECVQQECSIGMTDNSGALTANFPQCVNGYVIARAPGFKDTKYLFSTVSQGSLEMIMDKLYPTNVQLLVDGKPYSGTAMITFDSDYSTQTLVWPNQKTVNLGEGNENITVQVYMNTSITIPATTTQQCVTVPNGILGIVGLTRQNCFEVNVSQQIISNALAGGGNTENYFLESDLSQGKTVQINAPSLPTPKTIGDIQNNYNLFDQNQIAVNLV